MIKLRLFFIVTVLCLLQVAVTIAAEKKTAKKSEFISQGEFVVDIVTALGWEAGVPPEPREKHYLTVLSGKRKFRFEAENFFSSGDNVSVRTNALYGPFSGNGWLNGIAVPTTAHFKVFLPLDGTYSLTVAAKGDGQKWQIGGKELIVSSGGRLKEAKAGEVTLNAGTLEINVVIPPDGAVDYFFLEAAPLRAIAPIKGWNTKAVLNKGELAQVTAILLDLDTQLADNSKPSVISAADVAVLPASAKTTTIDYLGKPLANKWVRADYSGAKLDIPFTVDQDGLYQLRVRVLGNIVTAEVDDNKVVTTGKPYLEWAELGNFWLAKGAHMLRPALTGNQGIDVVEIKLKKASPADYMALCNMQGDPSEPVKRSEQDKIMASLAERFKERK